MTQKKCRETETQVGVATRETAVNLQVKEDQHVRLNETLQVPGPGALDGIVKCFCDTGGMPHADIMRWLSDTAPQHFAELGLRFRDLWGRAPSLIDWQNVLCEIAKYTRASHPHVAGVSGRTRIKQTFTPSLRPLRCRFPPKWGLPPERTATASPRPAH
jgi:hypothetical protein